MKRVKIIALALSLLMVIGAVVPMASAAETEELSFNGNDRIYTVATAHLDTVWFWPLETTIKYYIPNTFNHNFNIFEQVDGYKFNFEGAYRYSLIKEYYPEAFEQIQAYVDEGKWNPTGSGWENGDVNVPSAEALMRNFLYGNNFFDEELGKRSADIFLPDCFGFGYALPSIARHSNIMGFSTQKLRWGFWNEETQQLNDPPFDLGIWRGVDGSEIYAALDGMSYGSKFNVNNDVRNQLDIPSKLEKNKAIGVNWTWRYHGDGDFGNGPGVNSARAVYNSIQSNGSLNGTDNSDVFFATPDEVYRDLDALDADSKALLPVHDDELVLMDHAVGGYTSRALSKRWNRRNEILADTAERAAVAAMYLDAKDYPQDKLTEAWLRVITHQFHDDLPGTSLQEVYARTWSEYAVSLNQFAQEYVSSVAGVAGAMDTSVEEGVPVLVNNPLAFERIDSVEATVTLPASADAVRVYDAEGDEVPSQFTKVDNTTFAVVFEATVPSLGYAVYEVRPANAPSALDTGLKLSADGKTLENYRYEIKIDDNGDIAQVYDKELEEDLLADPVRYGITDFEGSKSWPSWELKYAQVRREPTVYFGENGMTLEIIEQGPARVSVQITRTAGARTVPVTAESTSVDVDDSTLVTTITLDASGQYVDVQNELDWQTRVSLLKTEFPISAQNDEHMATYDLGLGAIDRTWSTDHKYEFAGQKWADISDGSGEYGVSIFSDSKYGWDYVNNASDGYGWEEYPDGSVLRLTNVYTPYYTYRDHKQDHQDMGRNLYGFAIYGHKGGFDNGTQHQADAFNQPMYAFQTEAHEGDLGSSWSFGALSNDYGQVQVKAIKKAEYTDEIVVRFAEGTGKGIENVEFTLGDGIVSAREIYASEEPMDGAPEPRVEDGKLIFDLDYYSPRSFALTLASKDVETLTPDYTPLWIHYNTDVYSSNEQPEDGRLVVTGDAIPVELLPEDGVVRSAGVPFQLGPTEDGRNNATIPSGQQITLPTGTNTVYLLASAASPADVDYTLKVGDEDVTLTIGSYNQNYGAGDLPQLYIEGYVKDMDIGFMATHVHDAQGDRYAATAYMYKYAIDVPAGVRTITLPANEDEDTDDIVVFAVTAGNDPAKTAAAAPLYDQIEGDPDAYLQAPANFEGFSGFENDDPMPIENTTGNSSNVLNGSMERSKDDSVDGDYSIRLSGYDNSTNGSFCYYDVYQKVNMTILPGAKLVYDIKPVGSDISRYTAIDMNLSGGDLRDRSAQTTEYYEDETSATMTSSHPNRGHGRIDEWTRVEVDLSKFVGETINTIWFTYDHPADTGNFTAYVDNIEIVQDKLDLDEVIKDAQALDPDEYTEETYAPVPAILRRAIEVRDDIRATTAQKDSMALDLFMAMYNLEKLPDKIEYTYRDPYAKIEAEDPDGYSGIVLDPGNIGGTYHNLDGADIYAMYALDFDASGMHGSNELTLCYSKQAASGANARIELRLDSLDGPVINGAGPLEVTGNDWSIYVEQTFTLDQNITGEHLVYFVFKADSTGYVCNLDYFQFSEAFAPDYSALRASLLEAQTLAEHPEDYTPLSYAALTSAIEDAEKFIEEIMSSTTIQEIEAATAALDFAIAQLKPVQVDTAELEARLAEAKAAVETDYSAGFDALQEAISAAESYMKKPVPSGLAAVVEALAEALKNLVKLDVELDDLADVLAEARTYEEIDYDEYSYQALVDAIEKAQEVIKKDTDALPSELEDALAGLEDAIGGLKAKPADKDALIAQINRAEALVSSVYTSDSFAAMQSALENARATRYSQTALQSQVDQATEALETAIENLDPVLGTGKVELQELLLKAMDYSESKYTPNSYRDLSNAKDRATQVLEDDYATETQISKAVEALKAAIDNLVDLADKTTLKNLVDKAEALDRADYTADSYAAVADALNTARPVLYNANATRDEVEAAADALKDALDDLVEAPGPDVKELEDALDKAKAEADKNIYTAQSMEILKAAIADAEAVLADADASQALVNNAVRALENAIKGLVEQPAEANKTALTTLVNRAGTYTEADYTPNSYLPLASALSRAQSVLADDAATQKQVDDAATALDSAIKGLVERADKTALQELMDEAEAIDLGEYTTETVKTFIDAMLDAGAVLADDNATTADVDRAYSALSAAKDGLEPGGGQKGTAAAVTGVEPTGDEAPVDGEIVITFDGPMDISVRGTVSLNGEALEGDGAWSEGGTVFTLAYEGLEAETEYQVTIEGFKDVEGNTVEKNTQYSFTTAEAGTDIVFKAYIQGDDYGNFNPMDGLTRAQAAQMLYNLLDEVPEEIEAIEFSDVKKSEWYYEPVSVLSGMGIIEGYDDGTFLPNKPIIRAEFTALAARFMEIDEIKGDSKFADVKSGYWAEGFINAGVEAGFIEGRDSRTFAPLDDILRAEAVTMLNKLTGRATEKAAIPEGVKGFPDVEESYWGWAAIVAASTDHTCTRQEDGTLVWQE